MNNKKVRLGRYFFDFLSVFIAVISAFALNHWNDNRRDRIAEEKILIEIKNGLNQDLVDITANRKAHYDGIMSCVYFKKIIENKEVKLDSFDTKYIQLTSDNFSIMNVSGYESLKSRGLELIENDSVRLSIISLYEHNYQVIGKYEEGTAQMQIYQEFYKPIQTILSEYLVYDNLPRLTSMRLPLHLSIREKSEMNSYIFRILMLRGVKLMEYDKLKIKVENVLADINEELEVD